MACARIEPNLTMGHLYILCVIMFVLVAATEVVEENYIPPLERPVFIKNLRRALLIHKEHFSPPLAYSDLYCRCNEVGCDNEIVRIVGDKFSGICRVPLGGVCRTVEGYNERGLLWEVHLSCMTQESLIPLNRPFQCHTDETHDTFRQRCCKNASMCNDQIIPPLAPRRYETKVQNHVGSYVFAILVALSVLVSSLCLSVVYYLGITRLKNVFRGILSRVPYINTFTFAAAQPPRRNRPANVEDENAEKVELDMLFKPDPTEPNESSGYGLASLSKRTIARQITLIRSVAIGRFGEVHLGDWRGEYVAVKIFNSRDEKSWSRETDVYTTNTLRHNNILRWIASDNKDVGAYTQLWLVTEWMELGSLYDYLESNVVTMKVGAQMIRGIAHGLSYLHTEVPGVQNQCYKPPIAHRDLKSKNILVKNDLSCVIADLGLAVRNVHGKLEEIEDRRVGTVRYLSPELLGEVIPKKFVNFTQSDVYATALIFWEICRRINYKSSDSGSHAYELPYYEFIERDPNVEEMAEVVVQQRKRPTIDPDWLGNNVLSEMTRIMQETWTENAASRLTALNIRKSIDRCVEKEGIQTL